jgi:predicted transcriptional regulator
MTKKKSIYLPKWMLITLVAYDKPNLTCSTISRKSNTTLHHTYNVLNSQVNAQIMNVKREGKYTYYSLTDMGTEVATHVLEIKNKMKNIL